ncbi:MAG: efflux transporter outer membrane subunit [Planctomycetota bacterium]|jgi:NodT family efflux transporter outer membrane factor (OMF) lipoprotein
MNMYAGMRKNPVLFGVGLLISIAGCTVGPDYDRPELELPQRWSREEQEQITTTPAELKGWWTVLNDSVLESLIEQAAQTNLDLKEALFSIEESRALRDFSTGRYYPQVDLSALYMRSRGSESGSVSIFGLGADQIDFHSAGFDSSWEIDLFGGIKRSVESSQASLEASIDNYRDVMITLYAEVARNYVELRTLQTRIRFALQNIHSQQETLKLTEDRFEAGIAPELDVAQAKLNLANTESEVPSLRLAETQAINRIAVLLGEFPQTFQADLKADKPIPVPSEEIQVGLPADLLRRRPDIRQAERQLAAQTAIIGVATADLYPSFSLTGTFHLEAMELSDMGDLSSRAYSFGPSLRWNIFDGNRIRNSIKIEEARTQQARVRYERKVLLAVEEVENAITAYMQESQRRSALERSTAASEKSVELVRSLYKTGLTDFQNVLDMQRTLFIQQDKLAMSQGQVGLNLIRIYKALGGGWSAETSEQEARETEANGEDT